MVAQKEYDSIRALATALDLFVIRALLSFPKGTCVSRVHCKTKAFKLRPLAILRDGPQQVVEVADLVGQKIQPA